MADDEIVGHFRLHYNDQAQRALGILVATPSVRPEKFQFLEKWQNRNFDYKIVISVKNLEFIL